MNIAKSRGKKTKYQLLAVFVATLVLLISLWYVFAKNNSTSPAAEYDNSSTEAQRESAEKTVKEDFANSSKDPDKANGSNQANPSEATEISITSLYQDGQSKAVIVSTKLQGSSWTECKITLSKDGQSTITRTSATVYINDSTTCEGFSIDRNEFKSAGEWRVTLYAKKVDGKTYDTSQYVSIQ